MLEKYCSIPVEGRGVEKMHVVVGEGLESGTEEGGMERKR